MIARASTLGLSLAALVLSVAFATPAKAQVIDSPVKATAGSASFKLPPSVFLNPEASNDHPEPAITWRLPATAFQPAKISRMVVYALQLTFYEHVMRVATQSFTREQLKGKFWPEYFDSVHVPQQWRDKDHWQVNDIGHAISGGAFTRIWMEQRERRPLTKSQYLKAMGRATVYTAIFSVQYEIGPMSEASIGNVGLNPADLGWSDYIWTPLGGALWTMAEDAADKYVLTYIDKHVPFFMVRAAARMILNPSRMLANIGMNRSPWNRSDRDFNGQPRR